MAKKNEPVATTLGDVAQKRDTGIGVAFHNGYVYVAIITRGVPDAEILLDAEDALDVAKMITEEAHKAIARRS